MNGSGPQFPPLMSGLEVAAYTDPFRKAIADATLEVEPGRVTWSADRLAMRAALTLAPEEPTPAALAGAVYCSLLGFADALGALAPPELAIHFVWPDQIKVNGARCGKLRAAVDKASAEAIPDWLVVSLDVPFAATSPDPGHRPDETTLAEEGCVDFTPEDLIEAWAKHTLVWINTYLAEGLQPLLEAWRFWSDEIGEEISYPEAGLFVGLDEAGNMLLREGADTRTIPLARLLDEDEK